jgi:hemolysin D
MGWASRPFSGDEMKDEIEFLPAALEIVEKPPSPVGRAILWSIVAFFIMAITWSMIGEIDIVATAQGKIIPSGRTKIIQPLEIGVVRYIHVEEGDWVDAGAPLIDLDPTATRADLERLEKDLIYSTLDKARLRRLGQLGIMDRPPAVVGLQLPVDLSKEAGDSAVQLQRSMLQSEWSEHLARAAALQSAIESRKADLAATRNEAKKLKGTLPLVTRRADAVKQMAEKNLGPEQLWLELEEERVKQQQDLAALENRILLVHASIREAEENYRALKSEFQRQQLSALAETERRIDQLQQERLKAVQKTKQQCLTAPVSGVVQQLDVHTIGGIVTPAQELMRIVPDSQALEIEAWVLNKDIGFVEEGQVAEVKVETFSFTRYGTIEARVIDVSNDAVTDEDKGLVYASRVEMEKPAIRVGSKLVNLSPGMAVTVEVKTGKRRLIEYLLSPLLRYKNESLGER